MTHPCAPELLNLHGKRYRHRMATCHARTWKTDEFPVTFRTTTWPSTRQLVTSPKMLPGRLSPCWSTQSKCPVAEPSARSVTSIPNAVLPAASPRGCISAVPPPWMVATTVAPLATAVKTPGSFLGAVMSEQAAVTAEKRIAVAMRSLRLIIVNNLKRPPRGTYRRFPDLHRGPSEWRALWHHAPC